MRGDDFLYCLVWKRDHLVWLVQRPGSSSDIWLSPRLTGSVQSVMVCHSPAFHVAVPEWYILGVACSALGVHYAWPRAGGGAPIVPMSRENLLEH